MDAYFEVTLQSNRLQDFKSYIKYYINEKHKFEFLVLAQVEPVNLEFETSNNKNQMNFKFNDEKCFNK